MDYYDIPDHDCDYYRDNRIEALMELLAQEPNGHIYVRNPDIDMIIEYTGVDGAICYIHEHESDWLRNQLAAEKAKVVL